MTNPTSAYSLIEGEYPKRKTFPTARCSTMTLIAKTPTRAFSAWLGKCLRMPGMTNTPAVFEQKRHLFMRSQEFIPERSH